MGADDDEAQLKPNKAKQKASFVVHSSPAKLHAALKPVLAKTFTKRPEGWTANIFLIEEGNAGHHWSVKKLKRRVKCLNDGTYFISYFANFY